MNLLKTYVQKLLKIKILVYRKFNLNHSRFIKYIIKLYYKYTNKNKFSGNYNFFKNI